MTQLKRSIYEPKTTRTIALEEYKKLLKANADVKPDKFLGILCLDYQHAYNEYFVKLRVSENWETYCIKRDIFLQALGKIDLEKEIAHLRMMGSIRN